MFNAIHQIFRAMYKLLTKSIEPVEFGIAFHLVAIGIWDFSFYPPQIIYLISGLISWVFTLRWQDHATTRTMKGRFVTNLLMLGCYFYMVLDLADRETLFSAFVMISYIVGCAGSLLCVSRTIPKSARTTEPDMPVEA